MKELFSLTAIFLLLFGFVSLQAHDEPESKEIYLRISGSGFWMPYADDIYFRIIDPDTLPQSGHISLDLSPREVTTVTRPNLELLWRTPLSSGKVSLIVAAKYQHVAFTVKDTMDIIWEWGKHLNADLNFFSMNIRVQFPKLPLNPYLNSGMGYCTGTLRTVNNQDGYQFSVKGKGGGVFETTTLGVDLRVWNALRIFAEASVLVISKDGWSDFDIGVETSGDEEASHTIDFNRNLDPQGYQLTLGVEIPIR